MSHPFLPTRISLDGHGHDDQNALWVRFRTGIPDNPFFCVPAAGLNIGAIELWRSLGQLRVILDHADKTDWLKKLKADLPNSGRTFKVVRTLGWSPLGYVTPTKVFPGTSSLFVERDLGELDLSKFRTHGALEEWQDHVLKLCLGNSRLMFAVMSSFVGPLLGILGISGFGFQFFGDSSLGKTTILIVAGSVWGCRIGTGSQFGFLESWATTPEGVERYSRVHSDGFLLLDDTRKAGTDPKIAELVSTFIMRLADGIVKNRLVSVGVTSDARVVYLGSSNLSLPELFSAAGLPFDDAYRVRYSDIPVDAGGGLGAFEDIHDAPDAREFADTLAAQACTYFGAASQAFLKPLAEDRRDRRAWLVSGLRREIDHYRKLSPAGSPADGRIADHFGVVFAAGVLARHYGMLPWTRDQITWAVRTCHLAHLRHFHVEHPALDPIAAVRSYIAENLPRFRQIPDATISKAEFDELPGVIYTPPSGTTEYAIAVPMFQRSFGQLNSRDVVDALNNARLLVRTGDRDVGKVPVRDSSVDGREWAYRVRGVILDA